MLNQKYTNFLHRMFERSGTIKANIEVNFVMENSKRELFIHSKSTEVLTLYRQSARNKQLIIKQLASCISYITDGEFNVSGLRLHSIQSFYANVTFPRFSIAGRSHVPLPPKIKNIRACINIKNLKDNRCFLWCLLARFFPPTSSNPSHLSNYNKPEVISKFNMGNVVFPVLVSDIPTIENLNTITINVYRLEDNDDCDGYEIYHIYPDSDIKRVQFLFN